MGSTKSKPTDGRTVATVVPPVDASYHNDAEIHHGTMTSAHPKLARTGCPDHETTLRISEQAEGQTGRSEETSVDRKVPGAHSPSMVESHMLATLCHLAQDFDISTLHPLQFLDSVSMLHSRLYRPPRAMLYDKLTLLTLLLYDRPTPDGTSNTPHILLLVYQPGMGPKGYKPPCRTYNAASINGAGSSTISQLMQQNLAETLGLQPGQTVASPAVVLHEPSFGRYRLPGQDVNGWIIAQIYEFMPVLMMDVDAMSQSHPSTSFPGKNMEKVRYMKLFSEEEALGSPELDPLTRRFLIAAFRVQREVEGRIDEVMKGLAGNKS